jgi:5-enolpyruvylshikimate-3-phosphate synthase
MSKILRIVIADMEKQGAKVKETKMGFMVRFPDGSSMTVHKTESDHRALKNTRARVLRAGLTWPLDGK